MKPTKLLWALVFFLFSSCTTQATATPLATSAAYPEINLSTSTAEIPTNTSPSVRPAPLPTATETPDITALRTQGVKDPWITTTFGARLPPPWYRQQVLFSPDEKFLASSYSNQISLWESGSFRKLSEFEFLNENYGVDRLAFSSDGELLAATTSYHDDERTHLFVWNTSSMELKFSANLGMATLNHDPDVWPYRFHTTAIAFLPNSSHLAVADGNSIQIVDIEGAEEVVTIDLGPDMYATDISFPADGRFIYVFMAWWKDNGITSYPPRYQTKYVVQIWDTSQHFLWRTLNFPQLGWGDESKNLHGSYLVTKNPEKGTHEMMSLENEEVMPLPYRQGWGYLTMDNRYILFSRYFGIHDEDEQGMEVWTTDSWRMLYTFKPQFYSYPDPQWPLGSDPGEISISNDNHFLAIAYAGQVFIYDIRILTTS